MGVESWIIGVAIANISSATTGMAKLAIRKSWLMQQKLDVTSDSNAEQEDAVESKPSAVTSGEDSDDSGSLASNGSTHSQSTSSLEKKQQQEQQQMPPSLRKALSVRAAANLYMVIMTPLLDILATSFAKPSLLAPFQSLTLAWVVVGSYRLIGEQPAFLQQVATGLVVLGAILSTIFGDHTNEEGKTLQDVRDSYREPGFVAFLVGLFLLVASLLASIRISKSESVRRLAWGASCGLPIGLLNFAKDALTVFKDAPDKTPWKLPGFLWLLLVCAIGVSLCGLILLNACMKRYDAAYSVGMFTGGVILSASIMSAVHYDTFQNLGSTMRLVLYPVGLTLVLVGVGFFTFATPKDKVAELAALEHDHETPSSPTSAPKPQRDVEAAVVPECASPQIPAETTPSEMTPTGTTPSETETVTTGATNTV